jgi:hypothetical protein
MEILRMLWWRAPVSPGPSFSIRCCRAKVELIFLKRLAGGALPVRRIIDARRSGWHFFYAGGNAGEVILLTLAADPSIVHWFSSDTFFIGSILRNFNPKSGKQWKHPEY